MRKQIVGLALGVGDGERARLDEREDDVLVRGDLLEEHVVLRIRIRVGLRVDKWCGTSG